MDAVMMCRDLDPDPPNILESDEVTFLKLQAVWLTRGDGGCFLGESSLKSQSGGLIVTVIYFHHKHSVSSSFFAGDRQKCDEESVGQARG